MTHLGLVHLLPRGGGELGRPRGGERGGLRIELGELGGRQRRVVVVVAPGGGDDPPAAVRGGEAADEAAGARGERGGESGVASSDDATRARGAVGRDRRRVPSSRRGARASARGDPRGDRAASARGDVAHPPAVAERRANPRVSRQARRDHHDARAPPRRVPFPTLSASTRRRRFSHATRWTRPLGAFAATLERADANVRRGFERSVSARACRCGASDAAAARLGHSNHVAKPRASAAAPAQQTRRGGRRQRYARSNSKLPDFPRITWRGFRIVRFRGFGPGLRPP